MSEHRKAFMDYQQAFEFLSGLVDHERKPLLARDLSLDPVRRLLNDLGNPQDRLFIVHVAGTKGKGSVASMLEMILRQAGFRTGLYTSPDLGVFEERFRVNGEPIARSELCEMVGRIRNVVDSQVAGDERAPQPSCFDVGTALAFLHFESSSVDVAIIEVGMGGRTDSTNVCMPQLSVITSISFDHTRQLGSTLAAIASEKAGIIKPGRPMVSGVTPDEARIVVEQTCRDRESQLSQLGVDFSYRYEPGEVSHSALVPARVWITTRKQAWPLMSLNLLGEHQAANAAIAVAAVEQLRELGLSIGDQHVVDAMSQVQCPARIEIVRRRPLVILDCAHNIASMQALLTTLQTAAPECMGAREDTGAPKDTGFPEDMGSRSPPTVRRTLIFGSSRDKDLEGMLKILAPHFHHIYLTRYSKSGRGATAEELLGILRAGHPDVAATAVDNSADAWKLAESRAEPGDLICITGSIFLAGEVRALF
jgi:dihydrofolate synthase/folylpolyglutamate synthase